MFSTLAFESKLYYDPKLELPVNGIPVDPDKHLYAVTVLSLVS